MKKIIREIELGIFFFTLAALLCWVHYLMFGDAAEIIGWMVASLAFLPISVYLVSLVIDRLLAGREKAERIHKMNMVVGVFFSQFGSRLLQELAELDRTAATIRAALARQLGTEQCFSRLGKELTAYQPELDLSGCDFIALRELLRQENAILLRMLENPIILEHESFADLLWAVVHLYQELEQRRDLHGLTEADQRHLRGDILRAYSRLISQWLAYMGHLQRDYPYMFSLAIRTNPFDPAASAEVQD